MNDASKTTALTEELDAVNGGAGWDDLVDWNPDDSWTADADVTRDYTDLHGIFNGTTGPGETTWPPTPPTEPLRDPTVNYNDMHGIFTPGPAEED